MFRFLFLFACFLKFIFVDASSLVRVFLHFHILRQTFSIISESVLAVLRRSANSAHTQLNWNQLSSIEI